MGGRCEHKTINGNPGIDLIQRKSGTQVFRCKFCHHEWELPFQLHKLPKEVTLLKDVEK